MKRVILSLCCTILLTACLAGNMARDLSYKGRSLAVVEQRYGQPHRTQAYDGGTKYFWSSADGRHPCEVMAAIDTADRVTDIKMVGRNRDCYAFAR